VLLTSLQQVGNFPVHEEATGKHVQWTLSITGQMPSLMPNQQYQSTETYFHQLNSRV